MKIISLSAVRKRTAATARKRIAATARKRLAEAARLAVAAVAVAAVTDLHAAEPESLEGLCGSELKAAVARLYRPSTTPATLSRQGGVWEAFRTTDDGADGRVNNHFSTDSYSFAPDGYSSSPSMETVAITPLEWWGLSINDAAATARDLHNLLPAPAGTSALKKSYPPATVTAATYDNGIWKVGIGSVEGVEINCYQPPAGMEGDFARAVIYMITVYPNEFWAGLGANFLADNDYPTLQPWARRQLAAWHIADPVDDAERRRSKAVAAIQGNHNPFVIQPSLVEHIWGDKSGEPFVPDPPLPDNPTDDELIPLRGTYSLTDPRIDLYSPYIPDTATWSVDGAAVDGRSLSPASLGAGTHELRFHAGDIGGKIKIIIR